MTVATEARIGDARTEVKAEPRDAIGPRSSQLSPVSDTLRVRVSARCGPALVVRKGSNDAYGQA